ncbi:hypothetical protein LPB136_10780 [Tenacibaculum todarodis]|uniref:DUF4864 domain-containing protein n=1 Tax=Tenacibaculum todarodis TaxID=1850252 RepID=A0A1L3JL11_9FLAO|nr:hypothetical protein [Tenacibaculum todarodis]APG65818.1 hypothetical protein LPB136_10780 [Tenacibaculum todarodis]
MNNLKLIIIALLVSFTTFSQTKEDAIRDAKITSKATLSEDFNTVLKHTLPSVTKLMGGKEKALNIIEIAFKNMKGQGFIFEKADVVAVSEIVKEQGQYRCYIENLNQMKMPHMRIKSKSFLLGIYDDEGKKWWFIEAEKMKNKVVLDQILPNFETSLNIPKDEMTTEKL